MYEPIRQLIRENRLRKAMHDMNQLDLSREHVSRLVTLDRRLRIIENKQIGNLSEERLLTIEENGLVQDMLVFLDQVEYPHPTHQSTTTGTRGAAAETRGAAAGTGDGSKKGTGKWLGLAAALIALLAIGFFLWPETDNEPEKAAPSGELKAPPTGNQPDGTLSYEERKKLAQQAADEKRKEEIRDEELKKERERQIAEAKRRKLAEEAQQKKEAAGTAFMTPGVKVGMAVAVYTGQTSRSNLNESLTKGLSSFLGRAINVKSVSPDALTQTFHKSKERVYLPMGRVEGDKRLSPDRARYVVLADVRNVDKTGKADLRMCIYNTSTGKLLTRKESVAVGTGAEMQDKYIIYAVKAFLTEKLKL